MDNEFWFAAPTITTDCVSGGCSGGEPIYLRIGTIDWDAKVLVTIPITGDTIAYIDVLGGGGATIDLTPWRANIETGQGIDNTGILVQSWNETTNSVSGILITAFYEISMDSRDADNFVLKGDNALGTSFMVPTQNTHDNLATLAPLPVHGVYIVATEPSAITITLPPTAGANGFPAGAVLPVINLQAGETYGLIATSNLGANHLAGTTIESTGNIAVTMSDDAVDYNPLVNKADLNGDQIIPINLAGSDYIVMSGPGVNGSEVFITVINDGTTISIDGAPAIGPFAAKSVHSYLLATNVNSYINTSAPVLVYQLTSFQDFGGAILPPVNGCTGSHDVSIFRPTTQRFHMYIMVPTGATDAFLVNGVLQDGSANPGVFFGSADFTVVGNGWSVISDATWSHTAIDDGVVSKIVNTEEVFHLGVVSTIAANGTSYGYFSDFGVSNASAMEVSDASAFASVCFGDSIQLTATGGSDYEWWNTSTGNPDFLSNELSQSPVLTNIPVGIYKYAVAISGACTNDTLYVWVEIKEGIVAFFEVDDAIGCAPHYIKIDNLTSGGDDFRWDYDGDGFDLFTNDSAAVTDYTYYNNTPTDTAYYLRLYAKNSFACSDEFIRYIQVFPEIIAGFDQDFDVGCNPLYVQITDTSSGVIEHNYWEFGDGDVAVDSINPAHLFENVNNNDTTYTITLINISPFNCKDTATKDITVHPYIEANFSVSKNVGCAPFDVTVNNLSTGGITSYSWDFNGDDVEDDNTSAASFTIPYTNAGAVPVDYNLRLVVENANGCTDTLIRIIRVYPLINAHYSVDVDEGCNTLDVVFTNSSTGESIVDWDFGDGISSNSIAATINHSYNNYFTHDTIFGFSLHVESDYGCFDDTTGNITVYRTLADFKIDTAEGCAPLNVNIINTSIGDINLYEWYYDDGDPVDNSINPGSHTYDNLTGSPITRNLKLRVTGNGGCMDSLTLPVDVYSEVTAAFTPTNIVDCDSTVINFVNNSSAWATIYDWSFGDGTYSNLQTPQHVYRNFGAADVVYNTRLEVTTANGCKDTTNTSVTIHPYVRAFFAIDSVQGCSPHGINVDPTDYIGINEFNWDFDDGTAIVTDPNPNSKSHTYPKNTDGTDDIYNVTLEVWESTNNCSDTYTIPVTVYSESKADFLPMAATDCNPFDITFDGTPAFNASLFYWDFGDGASSNLQNPFHSFVNTTDATVPYTVNLEVTSADGCTHDTSTIISVRPYVLADFDLDIVSGCSPLNVEITNNSRGGNYRFFWDDDDLTTADSTFNVNNTFTKTYYNSTGGTQVLNLTLIADNSLGCTDTLKRQITVYSSIDATFTTSVTEGCHPLTVKFTNTTVGGTIFNWDFGDGTSSNIENPTHIYENYTTNDKVFTAINLIAESGDGCVDSSFTDITVYSYVKAGFTISDDEGCPPFTTTATNSSIGNAANTYDWYVDNAFASNSYNLNHTYDNLTTNLRYYPIRLEARNSPHNCLSTFYDTVTVYEYIDAVYNVPLTEDCQPFTVPFNNTSTVPASVTYYWEFGDNATSNLASPTHIYENTTFNDVTFTSKLKIESQNGCADSMQLDITAYSYVKALFSIGDNEGCPPFNTFIDNTSLGNASNTYLWEINGTPLASPTNNSDFNYNFTNNGATILDYNIKLTASNDKGCTSVNQDIVRVYEKVFADFDMSSYTGCTPLNINFTDNSIVPALTTYYWSFGDGASSGIAEPNHTYFNSSRTTDRTFTIGLTVTSPYYCTDDTTIDITVYHQPLSKFFIDKTSSCPPLVSYMEKESAGEDSFEWRFGDGNTNNTDASLTYTYPNTLIDVVQTYNLELWVGTVNNCKDSTSLDLNVFPDVIADFTYDPQGCSPFTSIFTNTSTSPAEYFYWNFDDGNTSNQENPVHEFSNTGISDITYNVLLKASSEYNCWDTITKPVTVFDQPIAEFNVEPLVQKFPENRVFIDNKSDAGPYSYSWTFGDDLTSNLEEPNFHEYEHWGEYDISLTINSQTSNCTDNITKNITILAPDINADFTSNINGGCLNDGLEVQFTAASAVYSEVYNYTWDYGDGSGLDYGANVTHTYESAGVYYVKMTAIGEGGEDYEYKTIRVYSNPEAKFEVMPKVAMLDAVSLEARIEYYNLSVCNDTAGCAYVWDFGDGSTAISRDVTHSYTELGKYDIKLTVTSANGCSDSILLPEEVEIIGAGEIAFPNAFTPNGDGLNDTFRPVSQGVIKYEMLLYNRWGELIFTTKDLSIGWDGKIKGEWAKPDVYVWKADGKFTNGRAFELAGDVTLIR